jgi:hypothetical protein
VHEALTAALRGAHLPVRPAGDTAMAAAWLAARELAPGTPHASFLRDAASG